MLEISLANSQDELLQILSYYINRIGSDNNYLQQLTEISDSYFKQGYIDEAFFVMVELFKAKPSIKLALKIAQRYYQYEEYEKAYYVWINEAKSSKENKNVLLLEARLLNKLGKTYESISKYRYLIQKYPLFLEPYEELADIYVDEENFALAEDLYKAIYDYFEDYKNIRMVRIKLMNILLNKELVDSETINEMVNDDRIPIETEEEFYALALFYRRIRNYDLALKSITKAMSINKDNIDYSILLMELYRELGNESYFTERIDWLAKTLPASDDRIMKVAEFAYDSNHLNAEIVSKLTDYFHFSKGFDEAYKIIKIIVTYYLTNNQAAEGLHFLKTIADPSFEKEYLSYYYAKVLEKLGIVHDLEYYYETALEYMLPEKDLVYDFANYYEKIGDVDSALKLLNKYVNSNYSNSKVRKMYERLKKKKDNLIYEDLKEWEEKNEYK